MPLPLACVAPLRYGLTLGVLTSPPEQVFGHIEAAQLLPAHHGIVVLDSRMNAVRVFSCEGAMLAAAGRPGGGPGEFRVPVAMDVDEHGRIHVLDMGTSRITRFELDGNRLRYLGATPLDFVATSFCAMRDGYVALGASRNRYLHLVDYEGKIKTSFGKATPQELVLSRLLGQGILQCSEDRGLIVHAVTQAPEILAYRSNGEMIWSSLLEGVRRMKIEQTQRGIATDLTQQGSDVIVGIQIPSTGPLVVQTGRVLGSKLRKKGLYQFIESRLHDVKTGEAVAPAVRSRQVIGYRESTVLYVTQDPFPQVELGQYEYSKAPKLQ